MNPNSSSWTESKFYLFQRSPLCFHHVTDYVGDGQKADGGESQVHRADPESVHHAQEVQPDHEIRYLLRFHHIFNLSVNIMPSTGKFIRVLPNESPEIKPLLSPGFSRQKSREEAAQVLDRHQERTIKHN